MESQKAYESTTVTYETHFGGHNNIGGDNVTLGASTPTDSSMGHPMPPPPLGFHRAFLSTLPAPLKIGQFVVNIILLCLVHGFSHGQGGGTVGFIAFITLLGTVFFFLCYISYAIYHLPGPWLLIEFISLIFSAVLHFISFLICLVFTATQQNPVYVASMIFSVVNMALYGVECFLRFRVYRTSGGNVATYASANTSSRHGIANPDPNATTVHFVH